jgi:hypothetical protein
VIAITLVAIVITRAKVPSSIGHSWMARARFSSIGSVEKAMLPIERLERPRRADRFVRLCVEVVRDGELTRLRLHQLSVQALHGEKERC